MLPFSVSLTDHLPTYSIVEWTEFHLWKLKRNPLSASDVLLDIDYSIMGWVLHDPMREWCTVHQPSLILWRSHASHLPLRAPLGAPVLGPNPGESSPWTKDTGEACLFICKPGTWVRCGPAIACFGRQEKHCSSHPVTLSPSRSL
jgi:hypothetical protein